MLPTLVDGQILAVDNLSYRFREPQRGDVIVFTKEGIPSSRRGNWLVGGNALVKRIIALPGDTVFIENGQIFVNDVALTAIASTANCGQFSPITINEGELFVMGDKSGQGAAWTAGAAPSLHVRPGSLSGSPPQSVQCILYANAIKAERYRQVPEGCRP